MQQPSLLAQIGLAGAAAVITVTFVHPVDVVKVRCLYGKNPIFVFNNI